MTRAPFPRPYIRLVPAALAPRRRYLSVLINVLDGRSAFGRSRAFHLMPDELDELIAVAARLERRS
jgi:hypothetical protein